eukprot:CAMPEP_0206601800 /NCGR_PEP_ID=MMETSP0325_2-20121206/46886_1 /ASSEMBLY_ACC=CAM_ASM_000347 /TAXON_ID=2866 /ORGANISM="Crypthecodinium cohnii, Strain Seligo" /LENGTH=50 /DNA_ID=CAMNT_0054113923 /DNA_START=57 /DNA_END=210 /DNA_ORIENTATION=-
MISQEDHIGDSPCGGDSSLTGSMESSSDPEGQRVETYQGLEKHNPMWGEP